MSCEKTLDIKPDVQTPKLVVEAQIESGLPPIVVLSSSLNYFSTIDSASLNDSYVHGANVSFDFSNPVSNRIDVCDVLQRIDAYLLDREV